MLVTCNVHNPSRNKEEMLYIYLFLINLKIIFAFLYISGFNLQQISGKYERVKHLPAHYFELFYRKV